MRKSILLLVIGCLFFNASSAQTKEGEGAAFILKGNKSTANFRRTTIQETKQPIDTYKKWEDESVQEFYEKVAVPRGTIDDKGSEISFVLVPTTIKEGVYTIEIADFKNDLYEIKGTDFYIKFRGYYGYAGYGDEGVLNVGSSAWSSTFYKKP